MKLTDAALNQSTGSARRRWLHLEVLLKLEASVSCSCGAIYEPKAFEALPPVGMQDDFEGGWLELRNCTHVNAQLGEPCRSTIARRAIIRQPTANIRSPSKRAVRLVNDSRLA